MLSRARRRTQALVRRVLCRTQGNLCAGCGGRLRYPERDATIDHVIAKSRGGFEGFGNVVAMCLRCNREKGDRWPTGCELIWLLAVNARLGVQPQRWAP